VNVQQFLTRIFGDAAQQQLKKLWPLVHAINDHESSVAQLSDDELAAKTDQFKTALAEESQTLDGLLPEAFAVVRETAKRTLGQRHFDVQLLGGIVMHQGNIAEMKTGEGKTLVATLPLYLNALEGKGAHIVTVNDYLARRDAGWMGQVYHFLGLSVGSIVHGNQAYIYDPDVTDETHSDPRLQHFRSANKDEVYNCDIVYGTNNEFGFDYLRDNMANTKDDIVQQELNFAIVDEVDSILIDEARTPLIISAPGDKQVTTYQQFARLAGQLSRDEDYTVDEKQRAVSLTEDGVNKVEQTLGIDNLYDSEHVQSIFHLEQALKAKALFISNKNYVVRDGEVIIVDEFTGRLMPGRRFSEGIHQAIEAKEGVPVLQESTTLATISFQNYFRLYDKLAGMTGTAKTEEEEFQNIYNLDVAIIPTNEPIIRDDLSDRIYKTEHGKFESVADDVAERHKKGQPVLLGTVSIEKNEQLSSMLEERGIPHEVLNAKNNEREAEIIARAGREGAVTLATNIAGRGPDIVLGGDPDDAATREEWQRAHDRVVELGGLHVLGSERHEARRIDNQLRGRSGRQGDPGSTQFYVSLEDDLMRVFGGERMSGLMNSVGVDEKTPIESKMVSRSLESAQKRVESHNYDQRKNVLQYDDVMNRHREAIYARRREILEEKPLKEEILGMVETQIQHLIYAHTSDETNRLDREGLWEGLENFLALDYERLENVTDAELPGELMEQARELYEQREQEFGSEVTRQLERQVYLQALDRLWMEHLESMDHLREGIHLRSVGQKDPLVEYKKEAHTMFNQLMSSIDREVATTIFRLVPTEEMTETETELTRAAENAQVEGGNTADQSQGTVRKSPAEKIGRNSLCPCGSGLKYKKCGLIDAPQHQAAAAE
jgi:preprotein translocase subunit SecA